MIETINCPYVGWSGGCDDCTLGLDPMTCDEEYETMKCGEIQ